MERILFEDLNSKTTYLPVSCIGKRIKDFQNNKNYTFSISKDCFNLAIIDVNIKIDKIEPKYKEKELVDLEVLSGDNNIKLFNISKIKIGKKFEKIRFIEFFAADGNHFIFLEKKD